jgi:hypothetical protein
MCFSPPSAPRILRPFSGVRVKLYLAARQLDDHRGPISEQMIARIRAPDLGFVIEPHYGSIMHVVDWVARQLRERHVRRGTITHLYLCSHGNAGRVHLGDDLGFTSEDALWFNSLRRWLVPSAFVPRLVLSGCNLGSATTRHETMFGAGGDIETGVILGNPCSGWGGMHAITASPGYRLLHQLAVWTRMTAIGGLDSQPNYGLWDVQGRSMTVEPSGRYSFVGFDEMQCHTDPLRGA